LLTPSINTLLVKKCETLAGVWEITPPAANHVAGQRPILQGASLAQCGQSGDTDIIGYEIELKT